MWEWSVLEGQARGRSGVLQSLRLKSFRSDVRFTDRFGPCVGHQIWLLDICAYCRTLDLLFQELKTPVNAFGLLGAILTLEFINILDLEYTKSHDLHNSWELEPRNLHTTYITQEPNTTNNSYKTSAAPGEYLYNLCQCFHYRVPRNRICIISLCIGDSITTINRVSQSTTYRSSHTNYQHITHLDLYDTVGTLNYAHTSLEKTYKARKRCQKH